MHNTKHTCTTQFIIQKVSQSRYKLNTIWATFHDTYVLKTKETCDS